MSKKKSTFESVEVSSSSTSSTKSATEEKENSEKTQARSSIFLFASKSDLPFYFVGVLASVIAAAGSPIQTYLYGKLFGELNRFSAGIITGGEFLDRARLLCGAVVAVGGGRMFFTWAGVAAWMMAGERQQLRARRAIFSRLLRRQVAWFDIQDNLMGSMTQVCRSIEEMRTATSLYAEGIVSAGASAVFLFVAAMESLWRLTLVIMALAPVMAGVSFIFGRKTFVFAEAENSAGARASQVLDWMFAQGDLVRILNGKYADAARLAGVLGQSQRAYVRMAAAMTGNGAVLRMFGNFLFVQGLWFGQYLVDRRLLKVSGVLTAFTACLLLGGQVAGLATAIAHLNQGQAAAATIKKFGFTEGTDDAEREIEAAANASNIKEDDIHSVLQINLDDVSFTYRGAPRPILNGISAKFDAHQLNFVVGLSGSGKSTVALLIMNLYSPLNGRVCVDHTDITTISGWPAGASLAELAPLVFARTVAENVAMACETLAEQVARACNFARIDPNLAADQLSGGQRQQVGLARAFARNLPVLILDEALNAIDTATRAEIWRDLRAWRRGKVTIVISHDLAEVEPQDRVLVLEHGRVLAHGRACEIPALNKNSAAKVSDPEKSANVEKIADASNNKGPYKGEEEMESIPEQIDSIWQVLRFFWGTAPSRAGFLAACAVCGISAAAPVALSYCTSKLLQGALSTSYSSVLRRFMVQWSILCIGIAMGDAAAYFVGHWGLQVVLEKWIIWLRAQAAAAVADQDMQFFSTRDHGPAQLTTLLMNDSRDLRAIVADFVAGILLAAILVCAGLTWALVSGWHLALAGFAFVPLLLLVSMGFSAVLGQCETRCKEQIVKAESFNNTVVAGMRTVKVCGLARAVSTDFDRMVCAVAQAGRTRALITGFGISLIELCTSAATGTIIYYGMSLVGSGTYSQGRMVQTLSLLTFTLVGSAGLVRLLPQIARGRRAGTLLARLVRMAPLAVETGGCGDRVPAVLARAPPVGETVVAFEDVHFAHADAATALYRAVLRGANVCVRAGECMALVGGSGSGKSTAALLMARLFRADRGRITFRGHDCLSLDPEWYREKVVVVPQRPRVFAGTVRENLCHGIQRPTSSLDLWRALEDCAAAELVRLLPGGLDARIADCALSLGQLQRLCVARAVVRRPQVLVFDECTLHLDSANAQILADLFCGGLQARHPLLAVVVITHDPLLAFRCGQVVRVKQGVFVAEPKTRLAPHVDLPCEFVNLPGVESFDFTKERNSLQL